MAKRYEYNSYVRKMIEDFEVTAKGLEGEVMQLTNREANPLHISDFAGWVDPWNPLWRDAEYAAKTRWGGLIAPPFFADCIATYTFLPSIDPRGGFVNHNLYGENWEFFRPIRPGDSFRLVRKRPQLSDITKDGDEYQTFSFLVNDALLYNQKDELIATYQMLMDITIWPEGSKEKDESVTAGFSDFKYSEEDLNYLEKIMAGEEIRGRVPRYWEDVGEGEKLKPVTIGPTAVWDMVSFSGARREMPFHPLRYFREHPGLGPVMPDPETGVYHMGTEWHIDDKRAYIMGDPKAFVFSATARAHMARCVTNWMGDDGEIIKMNWRHLKRTPIGDAQVAHGAVLGKRVEAGRHLVDLEVWLDNPCRGNVSEAAAVTVALPSSEKGG